MYDAEMMDKEDTREYIIKIAAPIFNRNGYAGTSLSKVLSETTLTKGAIYHYFENKDDLALAALEYNLKIVSDYVFDEFKDKEHACDKLIAFAESFERKYDTMEDMGGCPVLNAAVDSDDGNAAIKARINRFIRMWRKSLCKIIENGKSKNEIKASVNSEEFALNFISIIEGSSAMSKISNDKKYIEFAVSLLVSMINEMRV